MERIIKNAVLVSSMLMQQCAVGIIAIHGTLTKNLNLKLKVIKCFAHLYN